MEKFKGRLFLVIDETRFFHPEFVQDLCNRFPDAFVGAAVVTKIPRKNSIQHYLIQNRHLLTFGEKYRLVCSEVLRRVQGLWKPTSVRAVLKKNGIPFREVRNGIHTPEMLQYIASQNPDILISSNSLIFKDSLLRIPRLGCINRHSSLLPSYGGLWPVFQALVHGERQVGVTAHKMDTGIDTGEILAQTSIAVGENQSVHDLYKICFARSAAVVEEAVWKCWNSEAAKEAGNYTPSYFTFPTEKHWREFRARKHRFI